MNRIRAIEARISESPKLAGALVFFFSILVTMVFWVLLPPEFQRIESRDYFAYYEPEAKSIAAGHWADLSGAQLPTRIPPGYPIFLAGMIGFASLLHLPQALVLSVSTLLGMAMTALLLFLIARRVWRIPQALLAAAVWITYPFALWLTKEPRSEIPFIIFFYGGFLLFWHALLDPNRSWRIFFLSGISLGLTTLIRPISIGVGIVFAMVLWFSRRELVPWVRVTLIAALLLGNLVVILPWEAVVYFQKGELILLSTSGVPSIIDGLTFSQDPLGYRENIQVSEQAQAVMQDIIQSTRAGKANSLGAIVSLIAQEFQARPRGILEITWLKILRSWYATDTGRYEIQVASIQIFYLIGILLGSWMTWRQGGARRLLAQSVLGLLLYFWGMTFLALSILRYMVPAIGLMFLVIPGIFRTPTSGE